MSLVLSHLLRSDRTVRPLAVYFILNNRIYQSPDVYTLVSNRLVSACVPSNFRVHMFIASHVAAHVPAIAAKVAGHSPNTQARVHAADWLCLADRRAVFRQ